MLNAMYSSSQKKKKTKKKTPCILNFGIGNFVCVCIYIYYMRLPPKDRVMYIFIKATKQLAFLHETKVLKKKPKKKKVYYLSPQAL